MHRYTIEGIPPYDGTYEVDWDARPFTTRELGWIKRYAGYLPDELVEPSKFADPELIVVLYLIALRRSGKFEPPDAARVFERLIDAPFSEAFDFETDNEEEDDAGPPESSSSASNGASGLNSPASSGTSEPNPNPSGTLASGRSHFDRPTSVT